MSMILCLLRISDADMSRLTAASKGVHAFIDAGQVVPDRGPEYAAALAEMMKQMEAAGIKRTEKVDMSFDAYPFDGVFDVDKMWQGLYFLLTGTAEEGEPPVAYLLHSPPVSDEDVGYGPAVALSAARTRELSDHLDAIPRSTLVGRFDGPRMSALDIYPDIWDEDPDDLKEELGDAFDALKAYCRKCADQGLGMLCYIS